MVSDAVLHMYTRAWWVLLVRGLIALALGIFVITHPLLSLEAFALVIAIWSLVSGIAQVVSAIETRNLLSHWWLLLIGGIVSIGFGIAALYYYPVLSLAFAVVWTAYWLLLSGFVSIYVGKMERRIGVPWGWTVAFGVLGVGGGIDAIIVPPATLAVIMGLMAGFAIVGGAVQIVGGVSLAAAKARLAHAGLESARV